MTLIAYYAFLFIAADAAERLLRLVWQPQRRPPFPFWMACAAGLVAPGFGQIVNRQFGKAAVLLGLLLALLFNFLPRPWQFDGGGMRLTYVPLWLVGLADAAVSGWLRWRREQRELFSAPAGTTKP